MAKAGWMLSFAAFWITRGNADLTHEMVFSGCKLQKGRISMDAGRYREELRLSYRPAEVRVLFIGESPPANGTFFYLENSNLWLYTRKAFQSVYGAALPKDMSFCEFFMSKGCYLEDLCLVPVNRMNKAERQRACKASAALLARRISLLSPKAVICVRMSIVRQVRSAMAKAGLQAVPMYSLPFPSCGHQREYVEGLARLIEKLKVSGAII